MTLNRPIVPIITFQSFTDNQVEDFVLTRIWNLESGSVSDPGPGLRDWVTLAWSRRDTDERAPSCPDSAEFYRTQSCSTSHRPGNRMRLLKLEQNRVNVKKHYLGCGGRVCVRARADLDILVAGDRFLVQGVLMTWILCVTIFISWDIVKIFRVAVTRGNVLSVVSH